MWHKAIWIGHRVRLELTNEDLLVELANHFTTRGAHIELFIYLASYLLTIYGWFLCLMAYQPLQVI